MPGTLRDRLVIGSSVLVNESFKRLACTPRANLGRAERTLAAAFYATIPRRLPIIIAAVGAADTI